MPAADDEGRLAAREMIRVAIVDDHPLARRGIEQMLQETGSFKVLASVAAARELLARFGEHRADEFPDVVILDLYHDGDQPCLSAVSDLSVLGRVLVVSASGRAEDVVGAIRAGAAGYVTKHAEAAMFVAAVETVAAGGFALSSKLADILQAALDDHFFQRPAGVDLSPREEETLALIAKGFTHAQVASRMGVSKGTVDTYVERIRAKLQVGNKAQLARAAYERLERRSGRPAESGSPSIVDGS